MQEQPPYIAEEPRTTSRSVAASRHDPRHAVPYVAPIAMARLMCCPKPPQTDSSSEKGLLDESFRTSSNPKVVSRRTSTVPKAYTRESVAGGGEHRTRRTSAHQRRLDHDENSVGDDEAAVDRLIGREDPGARAPAHRTNRRRSSSFSSTLTRQTASRNLQLSSEAAKPRRRSVVPIRPRYSNKRGGANANVNTDSGEPKNNAHQCAKEERPRSAPPRVTAAHRMGRGQRARPPPAVVRRQTESAKESPIPELTIRAAPRVGVSPNPKGRRISMGEISSKCSFTLPFNADEWSFETKGDNVILKRKKAGYDDGNGIDNSEHKVEVENLAQVGFSLDEYAGEFASQQDLGEIDSLAKTHKINNTTPPTAFSVKTQKISNTMAQKQAQNEALCATNGQKGKDNEETFVAQFAPSMDFTGGKIWDMIHSAKRKCSPLTGELEDRNVIYLSYFPKGDSGKKEEQSDVATDLSKDYDGQLVTLGSAHDLFLLDDVCTRGKPPISKKHTNARKMRQQIAPLLRSAPPKISMPPRSKDIKSRRTSRSSSCPRERSEVSVSAESSAPFLTGTTRKHTPSAATDSLRSLPRTRPFRLSKDAKIAAIGTDSDLACPKLDRASTTTGALPERRYTSNSPNLISNSIKCPQFGRATTVSGALPERDDASHLPNRIRNSVTSGREHGDLICGNLFDVEPLSMDRNSVQFLKGITEGKAAGGQIPAGDLSDFALDGMSHVNGRLHKNDRCKKSVQRRVFSSPSA